MRCISNVTTKPRTTNHLYNKSVTSKYLNSHPISKVLLSQMGQLYWLTECDSLIITNLSSICYNCRGAWPNLCSTNQYWNLCFQTERLFALDGETTGQNSPNCTQLSARCNKILLLCLAYGDLLLNVI